MGVGSAARGTVALGVLVCGCVFAAVAGPALNLHTRTQALQQDLAAQGDMTQSVQASVAWSDWVGPSEQGGGPLNLLTVALLSGSTQRIARNLAATPLPLAGRPNDSPRYPYSRPARCLTKPSRLVPVAVIGRRRSYSLRSSSLDNSVARLA